MQVSPLIQALRGSALFGFVGYKTREFPEIRNSPNAVQEGVEPLCVEAHAGLSAGREGILVSVGTWDTLC